VQWLEPGTLWQWKSVLENKKIQLEMHLADTRLSADAIFEADITEH
jgi:hypothetical protein